MLDRIPKDLLHNVLNRVPLRDMARLSCVSPQLRESVFCALALISLKLDTQSPEEIKKTFYWLATLSTRFMTCPRPRILQLYPLAPTDGVMLEPALILPGEFALLQPT